MKKAAEIDVKGTPVRVLRAGEEEYACIEDEDMARKGGNRQMTKDITYGMEDC